MTMNVTPLASKSIRRHYMRGLLGLLALVAAVAGATAATPAALALLVVTALAWRGCPTCWAIGLIQTRQRKSAERALHETAGIRSRALKLHRICPLSTTKGDITVRPHPPARRTAR